MPEPKPSTSIPTLASRAGPSLDDWNLLRSFIAVYETGTLTKLRAAWAQHSPAWVAMCANWRARWVRRCLLGFRPAQANEQAHALHGVISAMKAAALEAERLFADARETLVGCVRVAASEVYATHVIAPILARLLRSSPSWRSNCRRPIASTTCCAAMPISRCASSGPSRKT